MIKKGIVITNNHVIQDSEDIVVRVGGDKEYKATIIGADPLSDIASSSNRFKRKIYSSQVWEILTKQELEIG